MSKNLKPVTYQGTIYNVHPNLHDSIAYLDKKETGYKEKIKNLSLNLELVSSVAKEFDKFLYGVYWNSLEDCFEIETTKGEEIFNDCLKGLFESWCKEKE